MAGPASAAATRPVITKMPAPMMAPMPSEVRPTGPSTRRRRFSPSASARRVSSDFLANSCWKSIDSSRSAGLGAGGGRVPPAPQEIDRDARQDQDQARPGEHRADDQKVEQDE